MLSCYTETDSLTTYDQAQNVNTMFPALLNGNLKRANFKRYKNTGEMKIYETPPNFTL